MGIISWIFLGLVAGALAKFFLPGRQPGGFIVTTLIGIAGALVGGYIGSLFGWGKVESFDLWSILVATFGAFLLLFIYGQINKSKTGSK